MGKGAATVDDATMVAGSRAIVDRGEQGSATLGCGVAGRCHDQRPPPLSPQISLFLSKEQKLGALRIRICGVRTVVGKRGRARGEG
jgi:hypothetical protein